MCTRERACEKEDHESDPRELLTVSRSHPGRRLDSSPDSQDSHESQPSPPLYRRQSDGGIFGQLDLEDRDDSEVKAQFEFIRQCPDLPSADSPPADSALQWTIDEVTTPQSPQPRPPHVDHQDENSCEIIKKSETKEQSLKEKKWLKHNKLQHDEGNRVPLGKIDNIDIETRHSNKSSLESQRWSQQQENF